jgi:hypothetical protein
MKTGQIWLAQLDPTVGSEIQNSPANLDGDAADTSRHVRALIGPRSAARFDVVARERVVVGGLPWMLVVA